MPDQPHTQADPSETLRKLGLRCASIITGDLEAWRSTARWLLDLPSCLAIATTNDAHNPNLHDGRTWITDAQSPKNHTTYVYDNEAEANRISGPICRRLFNGWDAVAYRFQRRTADRFCDFGVDDAKRIMLLGALILNRDFDGAALGLDWSWEKPEGCDATFEGRGWAWAKITSGLWAEASLLKLIGTAVDYLEALPSLWQSARAKQLKVDDEARLSLDDLIESERNIVEALGTATMMGEKLANAAGYPFNSNFKSTLSSLRKRHILDNMAPGYVLNRQYHYLLAADKGQDKGQD